MSFLGLTLIALAFSLSSAAPAGSAPSATLDSGVIIGTTSLLPTATVTVNQFLGVPFAQKPIGQNRFAEPQAASPWSSPLVTTSYAPSCIQQFNYPEATRNFTIAVFDTPGPAAGESEDCLYINVYVPDTPTPNKAVLFWIYGGSLEFGSNSILVYDGTSFAANQDVIIVEPNYRTNVFGFPGAPQLPLTGRNLGFLDQRLALDWVQRNIAAFGGDPTKVTLFGESAGAASVDELVTTLPDNPPFRAAILESGQTSFYVNPNTTLTSWDVLVSELNCSTSTDILSCVRAVDAETIESIVEHLVLTFAPISDNVTQLLHPEAARRAGTIARVPVMTGTNAQEGRVFTVGANNTLDFLTTTYSAVPVSFWDEILPYYAIGSPGIPDIYSQVSAILTDLDFQCPSAQLANDSINAGIPTWRYLFNASFPNTQLYPGLGVFHSSEIALVFGTYDLGSSLLGPSTAYEMRLSEYMQTAWATFAKNPMGGPGWTQYPNTGLLGGGNIAVEAGYGVNSNPSVLETNVPSSLVDARCALYAPLYAAAGT